MKRRCRQYDQLLTIDLEAENHPVPGYWCDQCGHGWCLKCGDYLHGCANCDNIYCDCAGTDYEGMDGITYCSKQCAAEVYRREDAHYDPDRWARFERWRDLYSLAVRTPEQEAEWRLLGVERALDGEEVNQ